MNTNNDTALCQACTTKEEKGIRALSIRIWETEQCEGGYMYAIYDTEDIDDDTEELDGGQCTTTLENALEMATEQAQALIGASKK